ncbi:MAG: DUF6457 domain-containing protein [Acidimicrobiales bacterium]
MSSAALWLAAFAEQLGLEPPTGAETEAVLALAATASHDSERIAAPIACWLAGRAEVSLAVAQEMAQRVPRAGGPPDED